MMLTEVMTVLATMATIGTGIIGFFLKRTIGTLDDVVGRVAVVTADMKVLTNDREHDMKDASKTSADMDKLDARVGTLEKDVLVIKLAHKNQHDEVL